MAGTIRGLSLDSRSTRLRIAMIVAVCSDVLQLAIFPLFVAGAESPADDALDFGIGAILIYLLGWHWELLPSFVGKLVPGVDLVPFWTLAVANVYRKSKQGPTIIDAARTEDSKTIDSQ
jgi:hypothetical protein